jgi:7-carboxy-7-deazaguanine synthase
MKARIYEMYLSISGEGISVGLPTVFIRFAGCSLRCGKTESGQLWCDTPYSLSFQVGTEKTIDDVLLYIGTVTNRPTQVLLTGGEPLESQHRNFCDELSKELFYNRTNYRYTRVETNGKESIQGLNYMFFSIDYKLPGSGMEPMMNSENFAIIKERQNIYDEVKFVVRDRTDFEASLRTIEKFSLECNNLVYSAVYSECSMNELAEWIKHEAPMGARLSVQTHKVLWGEKRGV